MKSISCIFGIACLTVACAGSSAPAAREPGALGVEVAHVDGSPPGAGLPSVVEETWPHATCLEPRHAHVDGSHDVELLGYLNPHADHPEARLSLPSGEILGATLVASPELASNLHAAAIRERDALSGPTRTLLGDAFRDRTMIDAVGTCGNQRASGIAVAIAGRARLEHTIDGVQLNVEVERIDTVVRVSTWRALAPRYRTSLAAVTRAVGRRHALSAADYVPLASLRVELRRAFGSAASLLEIDAVLGALDRAFRDASAADAVAALELRCRRTEAEEGLYRALKSI